MADHGEGGAEWERMCINRWLVFWSDGQSGLDSAPRSEHENEKETMFVEGSRGVHLEVESITGEKCSVVDTLKPHGDKFLSCVSERGSPTPIQHL